MKTIKVIKNHIGEIAVMFGFASVIGAVVGLFMCATVGMIHMRRVQNG